MIVLATISKGWLAAADVGGATKGRRKAVQYLAQAGSAVWRVRPIVHEQ